jgi:hypothetical protein
VTRDNPVKLPDLDQARQEVDRWLDAAPHHAWLRSAWLGPGDAPVETRLLTALHEALPSATNLKQVVSTVDRRVRQLTPRFTTLRVDWYLPPPLAGLSLGSK